MALLILSVGFCHKMMLNDFSVLFKYFQHLLTMACITVWTDTLFKRFKYGNNMGSYQPLSFFKSSSQMK